MSSNPKLSVVLSTRNRAGFLPAALASFERIVSSAPWELVVVNNASTDDTASVLAEFKHRSTIGVSIVEEPKPGLSRARNTGWRSAIGPIVAFTDDDCYPEPGYVDEIVRNFDDHSLGYLGGRILLFDPDDYPITIQLEERHIPLPAGTFLPAGLIQGANMAVRKSVLEHLHGFDELLGAGTPFPCEDIEFLSRASALGVSGAYDPRPVIYHHHRRRTPEQIAALMRSYDVGRGAYFMKCLLDPTRRGSAWRPWLDNLWHHFRYARHSPKGLLSAWNELKGAFTYLLRRSGLWPSKA
jgi:glycosyltransferase involved in cell wall biosynthesis